MLFFWNPSSLKLKNLDKILITWTCEVNMSNKISSSISITDKINVNKSGKFNHVISNVIVKIKCKAFFLVLNSKIKVKSQSLVDKLILKFLDFSPYLFTGKCQITSKNIKVEIFLINHILLCFWANLYETIDWTLGNLWSIWFFINHYQASNLLGYINSYLFVVEFLKYVKFPGFNLSVYV